jgi:hypothetical protein
MHAAVFSMLKWHDTLVESGHYVKIEVFCVACRYVRKYFFFLFS